MKANEAPDKIYLLNHTDYSDRRIFNAFTEKEDSGDIEYTRTNILIEKAKKWFEQQPETYDANGVRCYSMDDFEDFINYIKGEEV